MKSVVVYSVIITLLLSLTQFNLPNAFGGKIDYKKLYRIHKCLKCHGFDGKGTKRGKKLGTPDFTDAEWQASVADEQLIDSITNGKKKMPKRGHKMTPEEIKAMVKYIRYFTPKKKRRKHY